MGSVLAVCRVHAVHDDPGQVGVTAIDKRAVDGPVKVRTYGLYGDVQADREHHGGPDQAVYAYDQAEADHWTGILEREIPPGQFGENLRTSALAVDDAEIGQRWRVGETLELEVTAPRTPCATFARYLGERRWVRRFTEHGRTGAYLRVVVPGPVTAGDVVDVVSTPGHGVSVTRWFTEQDPDDARTLLAAERDGGLRLAGVMRAAAEAALARTA